MNRIAKFLAILGLLVYGAFASPAMSQTQVTNTWSSAGQLTQARTGAAAVLLTNGRVLITGGTDSSGIPLATTELYNPVDGTFTAAASMNTPRANHAAIVLQTGDVLVTGGLTTGGGYSDSAEIYSFKNKQWTLLQASIGTGLENHAMALLSDGNVLIAGGTSTTKVVGSIVLFNMTDKSFTPIGTLLTPRTNAVAAATPDGRVLIAGGADINGAVLASTEIFVYTASTMTGTVSAGPTMTSPRVFATATSTYDGVAVIGGNNGQNDLGTAEIFSQWTNKFKVVSGGTPRSQHFAILLPKNGSILAMGGTGGTAVDLLEPWANNKAGTFVAATASLANQAGGIAASANLGSLLAAGGIDKSANVGEFYWFPTVSTQNSEYAPGTKVEMSGTGFKPFELVDLHIHEWVNQSTVDVPDATVTANSLGNFTYDGYSPDSADIGARYHLTAVGESSGEQAQTIFGDSINSINFSNPPLNLATGACGALTLTVGGSAPYGNIYFYDSTTANGFNAGTGTFYSNASCTAALPNSAGGNQYIAGAAAVTIYYSDTTAGSPYLTACASDSEFNCGGFFFGAPAANQTETIYGPKLAFTVLPSGGGPGVAFSTQPSVEVLSTSGTLVTASTAPITLTLMCQTGGFFGGAYVPCGTNGTTGTLTCTANPTNATGGVANFAGCSVTPASANQYCLLASSPGIASTGATDACFSVTAVSTANSSVNANPNNVPADGVSTSTITVTVNDTLGNPVVNKTISLTAGSGASVITTVQGVTDGNGVATFTVTDTTVQNVTYTAKDTTDGSITIGTATVTFSSTTTTLLLALPSANPTVTGTATPETLTATLTNTATGAPLVGVTVTFTISTAYGGTGTAVTNASGVATYAGYTVPATAPVNTALTVAATSPQAVVGGVTYAAATGSPTRIITVGGTLSNLAWTTAPPGSAQYNNTFNVAASSSNNSNTINYSVTGACTINNRTVTMTSGTGPCYVTASIAARTSGSTHYTSNTITATVNATKAPQATLTVTGAPGSASDNSTFTVGYSGGSGNGAVTFAGTGSCTVSGTQVTMTSGTGQCSITVTQAADNNYASATSAPVVVVAASGSGTVAVSCSTLTYNGSQPTNPCSATTTPSGLNVTFTYNGSSTVPTNAGTYTVVGTINDPNYTGTGTGGLTISKAAVTAVAGSVSGTYLGSDTLTVQACNVSGAFTANVSCTDNPAAVGSTVGSGTVTPVISYNNGDIAGNYTITPVNGTWSIGQASSTTTLDCPTSVVYNGTAQTPCTATVVVTGASGVTGLTATTQYVNNTNVGIASAVATFPGNADVTSSSSNLTTFQITALPATIVLSNLTEGYTGNQATVGVTTTPGGLAYSITYTGSSVTYGPSSTPPVNPGVYTVVATITDPNYSGTTGNQTLTIGPITPPMILTLDPGSSNPSLYGTAVAFDLDVDNGAAPAPCPTGTVQFYVNGTPSGLPVPLPLTCNSSLFYQIATLPLGSDSIYASYSGDANYPPTNSLPLTQVVSADATGVSLTILPGTTINVGGAITFTATVTPSPAIDAGASGPGGSVSFYECVSTATTCNSSNGTLLGTAQLSGASPYTAQLVNPALAEGTWAIGAVYTSSDDEFTGSSSTQLVTVTVNLNLPNIKWATPDPIVYGTALSATQLDAQATDPNTKANVPGTYSYTPGLGIVPAVGSVTLQVTFTPDDPTTYSTQTGSVTLYVNPATLTVTADNQTMTFGGTVPTPLTATITGLVNGDTQAAYTGLPACTTTATSASPIGGYPITCLVGTLTSSNYTFTYVPGILQVTAGTSLTIATLPTASNITYGQTLASSVLTGGTATYSGTNVPGTFSWTTQTTAPGGGTASFSVTFTASSSNYSNMPTALVSVTVLKADPTIATLPTAAQISLGQTLSSSALTGGTATFNGNPVLGTFTWTTLTLSPTPAGTYSESVTFTPNDTTDYNTATTTVSITVNNKQTPTIAAPPAATTISYGQTLSASTLNPVTAVVPTNASVAGTFAWSTPTTVPAAGTPSESITFTPTDTTDYNTATTSIAVTVNKATPTIGTAPTASAISVGQPLSGSTLTGGSATNPNGGAVVAGTFTWTSPTTVPPAGTASYGVTFTPTDTADYNSTTTTVSLTVNNKTTPTVTAWPTASSIIYGQTLASSTLTPVTAAVPTNASVAGTFAWTTSTTVPGAGAPLESVTFTPTDTTDYNTVTSTVTVTVSKATPTIATPPTASAISVGQTLNSSTLTGGAASYNSTAVPGAFAWTTPTTIPPSGTASYSVTFTPTDATDYNTVIFTVSITVNNKTTPTITTEPTASSIIYGQTLASSTLTGGTGSVAGTFSWTTLATAPGAGAPSENVTFTPTDTTDYNTATGSVTVTVAKATPTIASPPTASIISVGQTLNSSTLTGGSATNPNGGAAVAGTFAWTSPTTVPPSGTASYGVTFTPSDTADYNTTTTTVSVTVNNKSTPTVTAWPTASSIIYGQTLASSVLTGGTASVAGTFAWTTPTTAPGAGAPSEGVTFTPTDTTDYNTVTSSVTLTVSKATPTVSALPTASTISSGQTLNSSTLTGGTVTYNGNPVTGTFAWTTPATVPPLGTDSESVTFTPTDTADYNTTTVTLSVTVNNKTTPTVTAWPTASAITYGQTLASSTLTGGTGSVAGTFSWTTLATVPGAGTDSESVTFTPSDTTDYNTVAGSVTVTVNKATPTVTAWPTAGAIAVGQTLASSLLTGGTASVAGTFSWTTPTTVPGAGAPSESVTFTPSDTTDYNTVTGSVTVTVGNKATPTVTAWPTASVIYYGQTLASSLLTGGTGSVAGTFSWTTPTTAPGAGAPSESVTFTPNDTTDYNTVTGSVTVTVNIGTPTVTAWPTAGAITLGQTLASSTLTGGTASVPGAFTWTNATTTPPVGTDSESVTFTAADTADYNTVTGSVAVMVVLPVQLSGYVVTVSSDDAGTASNCTPQTTLGHGTDVSCSLRDALLAVATGGGSITFDSTAFSTAKTITLSNGTLTVPTATKIVGPTTGTGATLINLVTVDGGNASTVFTVGSGVTGSSITNLVIQHGNGISGGIQNAGTLTLIANTVTDNSSTGSGAGISNSGSLTLSASTVSRNVAVGNGGGISNSGTLTLTDDTISDNTSSGMGGGIYNSATLVLFDSTVSGNGAGIAAGGGGIDSASPGTVTLANVVLSGNSGNSASDDFDGVPYTTSSGSIVGVVNGAMVNATAINLAPLGSYGGPTQTMIPLPGSPAICNGVAGGIPGGLATDQRGLPNTNGGYPSYSACVDSGAVQTSYALSFTTEPLGAQVNANFAAGVTLTESASPFQPPVTIPLSLTGNGTLGGGSATTSNGVASYTLQVNTTGTGDTLTANLTLNGGLSTAVAISATSNSFTVSPISTATVTLGSLSQTYTGSPISAMATTTPTGLAVTFTYDGGSTPPTAVGSYTVVGIISTPGYEGSATGTLTITQASTQTSLGPNNGSISPQQSVTLTAKVTSAATGAPTGSVNFYNGTTLLNTTPAPLAGGTATYTTTNLSGGTTYQITAVYSGDNNFLGSDSSSSAQIVVTALGFTLTPNGPTSQSVSAGSVATYQIVVAPTYGIYPGTVSFAATGQPSGATVTFSPPSIAVTGGQQTITMTVQTAAFAMQVAPTTGRKLTPLTLALFLIPLLGVGRLRRQGRRLSRLASVLLLLSCTLAGVVINGCGGSTLKQVEQNYTIMVNATSGNVQHGAPVTLKVQ